MKTVRQLHNIHTKNLIWAYTLTPLVLKNFDQITNMKRMQLHHNHPNYATNHSVIMNFNQHDKLITFSLTIKD